MPKRPGTEQHVRPGTGLLTVGGVEDVISHVQQHEYADDEPHGKLSTQDENDSEERISTENSIKMESWLCSKVQHPAKIFMKHIPSPRDAVFALRGSV
jgi:hypothetical protein